MLFSSEQVSAGHPDKICDQISDAILSDCLSNDRRSRVAVETMIKDNHVIVAGEITSEHEPDVRELVRRVLAVRQPAIRDDFDLSVHISKQSADIAQGVDNKGAGDQGMMFGYATDETHRMLPIPFVLATEAIAMLQQGNYPELLPDAKSQVSYDYRKHRIDTFLISTQHTEHAKMTDVQEVCSHIMWKLADAYGLNRDFRILVNPTGRFVTGGSFADSGVTGRKIIADTYGGAAHHGLCKRVAKLLGFGHAGANIQKAVSIATAQCYRDPLSFGDNINLWLDEESAINYSIYRSPSPRTITEIPVREVINAVAEVIAEEFSLPKDKVPTITARKLGFSSAGAKIAETINTILDMMLANNIIRDVNGLVSMNEPQQ